jgi:transglutaminase/protease-like cytokinesis protein 3
MGKIFLLSVSLLFSSWVVSQESIKATLININKYATVIDKALLKINGSIKADRHTEMEQQAEVIKTALNSVAKELPYLPGEYADMLSGPVTSFQTDIDKFEKLTLKKQFLDKDKLLDKGYKDLQQWQEEFRQALKSAYSKAVEQPEQQPHMDKKPVNEIVKVDTMTAAPKEVIAMVNNEIAAGNTTSANLILLNSIHQTQKQIEGWIDSSHTAMKKGSFAKVGVYAKNILNASLKISDLVLLLKSDRKEALLVLATGLKNLSHRLHELSHKGNTAHHEMHETLEKIEIKFNSLSTGISLVQ